MSSNTTRKVTLQLDAQTSGLESIKGLSDQLKTLAKQGGDTAPEFAKLATQLDAAVMAEEKQAASVKQATAAMATAKQNLLDARAAVSAYTASIGGARKASAEQAAELERLIQSVRTSKAELDGARAAISATSAEYGRLANSTQAVVTSAEKMTAAVKAPGEAAKESAEKAAGAFSGLSDKLRGLAGPVIAAFGGAEFWKANTNLESLRRTLELLTGSSEAAGKEIEYLRNTSNRLGIDVQEASRAYTSLTAAAKGTAMEGQGTRDIFEAVAGAMAKLGKSSADTEGALQAVAQMMSKGTVSMEEMRQQLGERLPGAMQAAADATGVTVSELVDMISTGQVLASDLLPKLAEGLKKTYQTGAQTDGMTSSWNRLKNAISETFTFIGDSGVASALTAILGQLAVVVRGLVGAFDLLGKSIGITLAAIASFDFSNWGSAISQAATDIQKKLDAANGSARAMTDGQKQLEAASKNTASAAGEQASSWLAVVNAYQKVSKAAEEAVNLAEKRVKAVKAESDASTELARAFGTEAEKRDAASKAASDNAAALKALADARRIEAETANSNVIALQEAAKSEAVLSEEKRKAIKTAQDAAAGKKEEADAATAAALSAQQHAAQLGVESAALADNSGRVNELRQAHEAAAGALATVREARAAGIATLAEEQAAAIEAGKAAAIYRDALRDQTDAIIANARVKSAQFDVDRAGIRLAIEQQRTTLESAKARGDEYGAVMALTEIKRLEVKLAELTAQAKRAEAEAALATVRAKREEIAATRQLTAAEELTFKAQEAGAQVKLKEAEISSELAKRSKEMADSFIYGAGAARELTGAVDGAAGGYDRLANSMDGAADAAARLRRGQGQGNSGSILDDPAVRNRVGNVDVMTELYRAGASTEEAKAAAKYYGELFQREAATKLTGNLGNSANATRQTNLAKKKAIETSLEYARQELKTGQAVDLGTSVSDLIAKNLANINYGSQFGDLEQRKAVNRAGNEANSQVNVNINLAGQRRTVAVASQSDANTLASVFRQIEADAGRAY